ncbi:uncharacterized protein [Medicago truncatula]|nr:uncharacterized protein LOC11419388 [Medicago truncatula]
MSSHFHITGLCVLLADQEMTDMHENTTMPGCDDDILESALDADPLNDRLSSEIPSEPFEGMDFASIEDVKNYYVRYAKSKGFSFRMGKSRTNGMVIGQEIVCSKEGLLQLCAGNYRRIIAIFNKITVMMQWKLPHIGYLAFL